MKKFHSKTFSIKYKDKSFDVSVDAVECYEPATYDQPEEYDIDIRDIRIYFGDIDVTDSLEEEEDIEYFSEACIQLLS